MQRINRWIIFIMIIVGLQLSACAQSPAETTETEVIRIEAVEGSDLKREILSEEAAQRLDIQTVAIAEEQVVRKRVVGGEIVERAGADPSVAYVRVRLTASDQDTIDRSQAALVRPLSSNDEADDLTAQVDESDNVDDGEDQDTTLYYKVDNTASSLTAKQQVYVELSLKGSGAQQKVVPYSAIVYDTQGNTWVYTSPEALTFVRSPVTVDYIDGDKAILLEGPPVDTAVVTVGAEELYGAEFEFEEE